ncbi:IS5 family transposase [Chenggangzhangella methanolivorans]|uniref:IS5 family transposase n=1 Tax=Chenggangzhangella methanolivorans TaxID=1437009 RepID=A0A9E6RHL4_9HYPH|nr:IS5 family transposase [Chenggangzhangella methanolivorans]QZO01166.1 IS5 family transposase [Chenggangzhangella methanolivorans]QZO01177.1 IS5 family transposase [Chenggangzhangella methanolivorans]
MGMRRHELSDDEWRIIEPLLPRNSRGVARVDDRRVINGILWRFRTGSSWRDVPERYGPRTTLYNRFSRWRAAGVWDRLLAAVSEAYDGDIVMIDSSCVRVHQHGAAGKKGGSGDPCMGRSRGGLTTKIHALVDAEGRPIRIELTAGQAGDAPVAATLLADIRPGAAVVADKAYDTDGVRAFVQDRGAWPNIPPRSIRKATFSFSRWVYRQRNLVERFFNRIKQMRGIATRYDRRADNFLAAIKLVAARLWVNAL